MSRSLRSGPCAEYLVPAVMLRIKKWQPTLLPVINLSGEELSILPKKPLALSWASREEPAVVPVRRMQPDLTDSPELPWAELRIGEISGEMKTRLFNLLKYNRGCFSESLSELRTAKLAQLTIKLTEDRPFTYCPYIMSERQRSQVRTIVSELLENDILQESNSLYSSPILLVKKVVRANVC